MKMSIIKRKKQEQFFMMSNHATQKELSSLNTIGLLAYIVSLPHDFQIYKTYLYKKFTRRTVDNAFKELTEKKYVCGVSMYVNRNKEYFYLASDEKLTQDDFNMFVKNSFFDIVITKKLVPKNLSPIKDNQYDIDSNLLDYLSNAQNVHHSTAHEVQYTKYSTPCAVPNEHIQINNEKDILQRNKTKDNNIEYPPFYNWLEN